MRSLVLSVVILCACVGWTDTLTVDEAAVVAVSANPEVTAASGRLAAARWDLRSARGERFPSVDASASYTRMGGGREIEFDMGALGTETYSFIEESFLEAQASISQVIWSGGAVGAGVRLARSGELYASSSLASVQLGVAAQAKEVAYDILRADALAHVAEQSFVLTGEHLRVSRAFFDAGLQPRSYVLRAEVAVADAEKSRVISRNMQVLARQRLNALLSRPLDTPVEIEPPDDLDDLPVLSEPVAYYQAVAVAGNPSLAAAKAGVSASEANVALARSAFFPTLFASGSYNRHYNTDYEEERYGTWVVSGAVNWNLFSGGSDRAAVNARREETRSAESDYETARTGVELAVAHAVLFCKEAAARHELAEAALVSAEDNHESVARRYAEGLATQVDELDASTALTRARVDLVTALYDYHVSLVRLEELLGVPLSEVQR